MSEITCGGCGAPLSHINAVCDFCLPGFYNPPGNYQPYDPDPHQLKQQLDAKDKLISELVQASERVLNWADYDSGGRPSTDALEEITSVSWLRQILSKAKLSQGDKK